MQTQRDAIAAYLLEPQSPAIQSFIKSNIAQDFALLDWVCAAVVGVILLICFCRGLVHARRSHLTLVAKWVVLALIGPATAFVVFHKSGSHGVFFVLQTSKGICAGYYAILAALIVAKVKPDARGVRVFAVCSVIGLSCYMYLANAEVGFISATLPTEILQWVFLIALGVLTVRSGHEILRPTVNLDGAATAGSSSSIAGPRRILLILTGAGAALFFVTLSSAYSTLVRDDWTKIHYAVTDSRRKLASLLRQKDRISKLSQELQAEARVNGLPKEAVARLEGDVAAHNKSLEKIDLAIQKGYELVLIAEKLAESSKIWSPQEVETITSVLRGRITEELDQLGSNPAGLSDAVSELNKLLMTNVDR
jgi:hypothetical protein